MIAADSVPRGGSTSDTIRVSKRLVQRFMPQRERRAGQNIRELALRRRLKSVTSFIGAGLLALCPILLFAVASASLEQITSNGPTSSQYLSYGLPILYAALLVAAVLLTSHGIRLWKMANRADQGAKGEEIIGRELSILKSEGWQFEYGMRLENRLGDADIVCLSPQGRAYIVDVKSHRGKVITDNQMLSRRVGRKTYSFEKDFISQTMKQALQVRKQKKLNFVTPVLAFSSAEVSLPSNKLRNVYVVERAQLTSLLRMLG